MNKLFITVIILSFTTASFAQDTLSQKQNKKEQRKQRINALVKQEEEGVIAYQKHIMFWRQII
ncbi:MAG: hypothetical protein IPJ81_19125 [Chitinophagaceae bacterium]|nr:hypothetical protein [Chitinophagaceae bacterium]